MSVSLYGSGNTVIQVVTATQSTVTSTTSSSFVTTGLSATITPQSTNSKILVLHSAGCYVGSANGQAVVTACRGSTNIGGVSGFVNVYSSASAVLGNLSFSYLDSPATTSATTYTIYFANQNNSANCQYNSGATGTAIATITLLEISGS